MKQVEALNQGLNDEKRVPSIRGKACISLQMLLSLVELGEFAGDYEGLDELHEEDVKH